MCSFIFILLLCAGQNDVERLPEVDEDEKSLRFHSLLEQNEIELEEVTRATRKGQSPSYSNVKLKMFEAFSYSNGAIVFCLRNHVQTWPGSCILRFMLFDETGKYLDMITLDVNFKVAFMDAIFNKKQLNVVLKNTGGVPKESGYSLFASRDTSSWEFCVMPCKACNSNGFKVDVKYDAFVVVLNSFSIK